MVIKICKLDGKKKETSVDSFRDMKELKADRA